MFREEKLLTPIAYFNQHNPDYYKSDYWRQDIPADRDILPFHRQAQTAD
jgi:hypothetical protein